MSPHDAKQQNIAHKSTRETICALIIKILLCLSNGDGKSKNWHARRTQKKKASLGRFIQCLFALQPVGNGTIIRVAFNW